MQYKYIKYEYNMQYAEPKKKKIEMLPCHLTEIKYISAKITKTKIKN